MNPHNKMKLWFPALLMVANLCCCGSWRPRESHDGTYARTVWKSQMRIVENSIALWENRSDSTTYDPGDLAEAIAFFENLTGVASNTMMTYMGPIPDENLKKATKRWKVWYRSHADWLGYDPTKRARDRAVARRLRSLAERLKSLVPARRPWQVRNENGRQMKDVRLLQPGQRVRVADDHHWAQRASGTIVDPGDEIKGIAAGWDGPGRVVDATDGDIRFLWIEFDEPQFDADGDGPYSSAEVDARFVIYAD